MNDVLETLEGLGALVGVLGLLLTAWSIIDDISDRRNVSVVGSLRGPRYIAATGSYYSNFNLIVGWLLYLYTQSIALYLPTRTDASGLLIVSIQISVFVYGVMFLLSQVHHRVARAKMRKLKRKDWVEWIRDLVRQLPKDEVA